MLLEGLERQTDRASTTANRGHAPNERYSISLSRLVASLVKKFLAVANTDDSTLSSLQVPDRCLVEQSLGTYFCDLDMMYPAFDERLMREHVEMTYDQTSTSKCLAALVCYRYVMAQARKVGGPVQQSSSENEVHELVRSSNVLLRHVADAKSQLIDVQALTISVRVSIGLT